MRYAEPHALCPPPVESLSRPVSFVRDPPTWLPSVLVGHLYGLRSTLVVCPGLRASAPDTALRWAATNSLRSVFTMHGDAAADGGGGASLGPADADGAAGGVVVVCGSAIEAAAAGAAVGGGAAGDDGTSSEPDERPFLQDTHGRLASSDPCTSYIKKRSTCCGFISHFTVSRYTTKWKVQYKRRNAYYVHAKTDG